MAEQHTPEQQSPTTPETPTQASEAIKADTKESLNIFKDFMESLKSGDWNSLFSKLFFTLEKSLGIDINGDKNIGEQQSAEASTPATTAETPSDSPTPERAPLNTEAVSDVAKKALAFLQQKDGANNASTVQSLFLEKQKSKQFPEGLLPLVSAIRYAENGGPGRQFGIVTVSAPSYQEQASVCMNTVQNILKEYKGDTSFLKTGKISKEFIRHVQKIYCPVGADNDPTGLNKHWYTNVTKALTDMGMLA